MLEETADETFKAYMTRKTQGWFRRWGCDATAASPGPGAAPNGAGSGGGAGAATPARLPVLDASDDEDGSVLITPAGPGGGRRRSCAIANPGHGNVVVKRGPDAGGVGARHPRLQDFNLGTLITGACDDHLTSPIVTLETLPSEGRA